MMRRHCVSSYLLPLGVVEKQKVLAVLAVLVYHGRREGGDMMSCVGKRSARAEQGKLSCSVELLP